MSLNAKVIYHQNDHAKDTVYVVYRCPGCAHTHYIPVTGPKAWGFNWNIDSPTLSPSILEYYPEQPKDAPPFRCHHFLRDGRIEFLSDCLHNKKNQTIDLPVIGDDWRDEQFQKNCNFSFTRPA